MAGTFWLAYRVEPPASLPFAVAVSMYLLMYLVAGAVPPGSLAK